MTEIRRLRKQVYDFQCETADLQSGNDKLAASLNASSEHLNRMVTLCDGQRAEIAELKGIVKTLVKYV